MENIKQPHHSMKFTEQDGKTFVVFHDLEGNLVAKREISYQDMHDSMRLNRGNN